MLAPTTWSRSGVVVVVGGVVVAVVVVEDPYIELSTAVEVGR